MPPLIRKVLKIIGYAAGALVGIAGLYIGTAFVLSRIPVQKADPEAAPDVEFGEVDPGWIEREHARQQVAVEVRHLGRTPHLHVASRGIPAGGESARLEWHR